MKQSETAPQVSNQYFRVLRLGIALLLCALVACFGSLSYQFLKAAEVSLLKSVVSSSYQLINDSVQTDFNRIVDAADVVNNLFGHAIQNSYGGVFPNLTLPGFESTINSLCKLSGLEYIAFSPLISNRTRTGWETYVKANVRLLDGPSSLITSTANGIANLTSDGRKVYDTGYIDGSLYPSHLFPVWQVAPISDNAGIVMVDFHALVGNGIRTIDNMLTNKKPYIIEAPKMISSEDALRVPKGVIFSPILSFETGNPVVGLFTGEFSWEKLFINITTTSVYLVVHVENDIFTFHLDNGGVRLTGRGDIANPSSQSLYTLSAYYVSSALYYNPPLTDDLHDKTYDDYSQSFFPIDGSDFKITIYPTSKFYKTYITNHPRDVCMSAVFIVAFTACIVFVYSKWVRNREITLVEAAKVAFADAASRDAVILAKKSYVRYISHEMRTPLNSTFMGLKLLEIELAKHAYVPGHEDRVDTLKDVTNSCDLVLNILNDLLNYDKLEFGDMKLDKKSLCLLPFVVDSVNSLALQGKNKDVKVLFDIDEMFVLQPYRNRWRNGRLEGRSADTSRRSSDIHVMIARPVKVSEEAVQGAGLPDIMTEFTAPPMAQSLSGLTYLTTDDCVEADEHKLQQVIMNLVSNAIKFTPSGRSVTIKMRKIPASVCEAESRESPLSPNGGQKGLKAFSYASLFNNMPSPVQEEAPRRSSIYTETHPHSDDIEMNSLADRDIDSISMPCPTVFTAPLGCVVIEFIDEGVGMAAEDCKQLFKSIVQFNPNELQAGGGSGLGMMITKGIVDLHCGSISAYSAGLRKGSTFKLVLPLSGMSPPPPAPASKTLSRLGSDLMLTLEQGHVETSVEDEKDGKTENERKLYRFLVVDDSLMNRKMLSKLLISCGHTCLQAVDGIDAIEKFKENSDFVPMPCHPSQNALPGVSESISASLGAPTESSIHNDERTVSKSEVDQVAIPGMLQNISDPVQISSRSPDPSLPTVVRTDSTSPAAFCSIDAILMDFMMPNMDGPTATKAIREMGYRGPIVGVTGNALPSDIEHFIAHGADRVVLKPVDLGLLKQALVELDLTG